MYTTWHTHTHTHRIYIFTYCMLVWTTLSIYSFSIFQLIDNCSNQRKNWISQQIFANGLKFVSLKVFFYDNKWNFDPQITKKNMITLRIHCFGWTMKMENAITIWLIQLNGYDEPVHFRTDFFWMTHTHTKAVPHF